MVAAAYLTTAFVVIAVGAYHLLRSDSDREGREAARVMVSMGFWFILVVAPIQIFLGDQHGLEVRDRQPAKLAAIEGHWSTSDHVPLLLFAVPDPAKERNNFEIGIPDAASLIVTHSASGTIKGLTDFPREDRPPVAIVFYSFRVMVGLGFLMVAMALWGAFLRWRGRLYDTRWFHRICTLASPLGFFAVTFGWITTEHGRQPWVVYGLLRTADAVSAHGPAELSVTLLAFVLVYCIVFGSGIVYMMRLIRVGPVLREGEHPVHGGTPMRPMSAAGGNEPHGG
jgi:cytochrome d ubiquinol oxidase subunit I